MLKREERGRNKSQRAVVHKPHDLTKKDFFAILGTYLIKGERKMKEKRTFSLPGNYRYGISEAQIETIMNLFFFESFHILVLSPILIIADQDCQDVYEALRRQLHGLASVEKRGRILKNPATGATIHFFAHTQDPIILRGFKFTRCFVTGIIDREKAQAFEQEYLNQII